MYLLTHSWGCRGVLLLLTLTGCSTYADRVASTCAGLGAPRGSSHYWSCVQQQQEIDQRDRAAWGVTTAAGAALMAPRPAYYILPRY